MSTYTVHYNSTQSQLKFIKNGSQRAERDPGE